MRLFVIAFISYFQVLLLHAQVEQVIEISTERDKDGNYTFFADNNSFATHHVAIWFETISGFTVNASLPANRSIEKGNHLIFKILKNEMGNQNFRYTYTYRRGTANPKIKDIAYALPVAQGKQTKTLELTSIDESYRNKKAPEGYYSIGFTLNEGDTLFAARGGRVIRLIQSEEADLEGLTFSSDRNILEIEHPDGTIGQYSIFKKNGALVEVGDDVLMGTPLALAGGKNYLSGYQVRFSVYYLHFDASESQNSKDWYSFKYITPEFVSSTGERKVLQPNIKYRSLLTEEMIMADMSRKERKRYLKSKSSK